MKLRYAALTLLVTSTLGAWDYSYPDPCCHEQPFSWCGFYMGVHGGLSKGRERAAAVLINGFTYNSPFEFIASSSDHLFGGLQAGFNYPFSYKLVGGIEADFGSINFSARKVSQAIYNTQQDTFLVASDGTYGTATARLGLVYRRTFFYAKGGYAATKHKIGIVDEDINGGTIDTRRHQFFNGFAIGGGIEYRFSKCLSAKVEYLFMDFERRVITGLVNEFFLFGWRHHPSLHTVKIGLNFIPAFS